MLGGKLNTEHLKKHSEIWWVIIMLWVGFSTAGTGKVARVYDNIVVLKNRANNKENRRACLKHAAEPREIHSELLWKGSMAYSAVGKI